MTNVNILSSILKFLRGVFSYSLWFFFRLGTVTEVNTPCSPVQAQVESGKFPMCYILLFQESTVRSLCFASLIRFFSVIKLIAALVRFIHLVYTVVVGKQFTGLV